MGDLLGVGGHSQRLGQRRQLCERPRLHVRRDFLAADLEQQIRRASRVNCVSRVSRVSRVNRATRRAVG